MCGSKWLHDHGDIYRAGLLTFETSFVRSVQTLTQVLPSLIEYFERESIPAPRILIFDGASVHLSLGGHILRKLSHP